MPIRSRWLAFFLLLPWWAAGQETPSPATPASPAPAVEAASGEATSASAPAAAEAPAQAEAGAPAVGTVRVRILHAAPRQAPLTVFVDGVEQVTGLAYGELSGYLTLPAGPHRFTAVPGGGAPQADQTATFLASETSTVAWLGGDGGFRWLQIRDAGPSTGESPAGRWRVTNLVAGRQFTLTVADRAVAALLQTGQSTPLLTGGPGPVALTLTDTTPGGPILTPDAFEAREGELTSLYLLGLPGAEDDAAVRVIADTQPLSTAGTPLGSAVPVRPRPPLTRLRVLHLAGGSPPLAGTLDGKPLFANLAFGAVTPYLPQTAGAHSLALVGAPWIDREPLVLREHQDHTLVLCGEPDRVRWWLLFDDPGRVARPALRLVHCAWQAGELVVSQLEAGPLAAALGYFDHADYQPVTDLVQGQRLDVAIRPAGRSTVVQAARLLLEPDAAYTLYLADSGTGDAEAVRLKLLKDGGP